MVILETLEEALECGMRLCRERRIDCSDFEIALKLIQDGKLLEALEAQADG